MVICGWKHEDFICAGETRSAGYVWRFTTGKIPKVPQVIEACNEDDWDDPEVPDKNFLCQIFPEIL